ncbi:MAG: glycosyltransferase [Deltaproteobacteria bacterium]|nr:glycosyltransferase [Deltaproteobacteria bacterium]
MRKTAVIIPCYNEAGRLDLKAFIAGAAKCPALHFIFVNDGSTDSTASKLETLHRQNPAQMHAMSLEKNSGKAEAVRQGVLKALDGDYSNIGYWDADLATPLDEIPVFCEILDSADVTVVAGSRVRLLGRAIERRPLRHFLGRIFATFASLILEIPVYDTQCGAKIFKRTGSLKDAFSAPFRVKWTFDVELLARLAILERAAGNLKPEERWVERPLDRWTDVQGSKIKSFDFIKGGVELLKLFSFLHLPVVKERYRAALTKGKGPRC